jgi:uncharacterized integral membrane protein
MVSSYILAFLGAFVVEAIIVAVIGTSRIVADATE